MTMSPQADGPSGASVERVKPPLLSRQRLIPAATTIGAFGAVLVIVQIVNSVSSYALSHHLGIRPRSLGGLWGILGAPVLHAGWGHLMSNLVPFLIFGFLLLVTGLRQFISVTVLVWLVSGIGVWLTGPGGTVTVGASSLVFGWLAFLVLRGVFARHFGQIVLGAILLVLWGGIFWGILPLQGDASWGIVPGRGGVSWQGHLFGAIAGALAAFLVARADAPRRSAE